MAHHQHTRIGGNIIALDCNTGTLAIVHFVTACRQSGHHRPAVLDTDSIRNHTGREDHIVVGAEGGIVTSRVVRLEGQRCGLVKGIGASFFLTHIAIYVYDHRMQNDLIANVACRNGDRTFIDGTFGCRLFANGIMNRGCSIGCARKGKRHAERFRKCLGLLTKQRLVGNDGIGGHRIGLSVCGKGRSLH